MSEVERPLVKNNATRKIVKPRKIKHGFITIIRLWGMILLTLLAVAIVLIDSITTHHYFNIRMDDMRENYVEQQKLESKREVERIVNMINHERTQIEIQTKVRLKVKVNEAYSVALNIYEKNKLFENDAEIQKMIINALSPIRFDNSNGYYEINSFTGKSIIAPPHQVVEDQRNVTTQEARNTFLIKKEEGFVSEYWPKTDSGTTKKIKKITFVKIFKPYNWSIFSALDLDIIDEQIKSEWMDRINNIRFGTNLVGYLFAADWSGKSLAHGAQADMIGNNGWEWEDSRGNKTTQLLVAASKKEDGGYAYFWWRKPDTGKESPKIAYAKGIPEWELLIASGVYTDDIERNISNLHASLNKEMKTNLIIFIVVIAVVFILLYILFGLLSNRLRKDTDLFITFFSQAAFANKEINRENIQFDEIDQMAKYANKMLQDKKKAQQSIQDERDKIDKLNQELEQRVLQRTDDLQMANKELESFSYSVSHDLRAPLRAISGYSQILIEDYADKLGTEGIRQLNVVQESTSEMGQLIDDLLRFSRLGQTEIQHSLVDMEVLAKEAFEKLQDSETIATVQLIVKTLPRTIGDRDLLHVVFTNLLSNAIKFSKPKNNVSIEITGTSKGNENIYSVKDNGVGFDMNYIDKIFQVFQRLHSSKDFEGTGIGLALVQRIIKRLGGRVWAEGEVNKGATLYFTIPRQEENENARRT